MPRSQQNLIKDLLGASAWPNSRQCCAIHRMLLPSIAAQPNIWVYAWGGKMGPKSGAGVGGGGGAKQSAGNGVTKLGLGRLSAQPPPCGVVESNFWVPEPARPRRPGSPKLCPAAPHCATCADVDPGCGAAGPRLPRFQRRSAFARVVSEGRRELSSELPSMPLDTAPACLALRREPASPPPLTVLRLSVADPPRWAVSHATLGFLGRPSCCGPHSRPRPRRRCTWAYGRKAAWSPLAAAALTGARRLRQVRLFAVSRHHASPPPARGRAGPRRRGMPQADSAPIAPPRANAHARPMPRPSSQGVKSQTSCLPNVPNPPTLRI